MNTFSVVVLPSDENDCKGSSKYLVVKGFCFSFSKVVRLNLSYKRQRLTCFTLHSIAKELGIAHEFFTRKKLGNLREIKTHRNRMERMPGEKEKNYLTFVR